MTVGCFRAACMVDRSGRPRDGLWTAPGAVRGRTGVMRLNNSQEVVAPMYMVTIDKGKCDGDGTCVNLCPQSVFALEGGKADPVNMSECINCLTCVENCPQQAITVSEL